MKFTGEVGSARKKICLSATTNPTRSGLGSNWGLRTEKPRTEHLRHGRALRFSVSSSQESVSCVISYRVATVCI
jgi:hypothetical protein